ncbi:MAG: MerR family transcriptional regulator [Acetobacterium woodii]|nr:MerR family transcriptional regulator [Acetobacterium woodii]
MENKTLLTVGELAKQMDVTVRTLQYYDQQNLLKPSHKSEGGRRLYSKKDMVKLHQILSLKHLGFSLEEIKTKLFALETPKEVCQILLEQRTVIENQIQDLQNSLAAIDALRDEVIAIDKVDFSKYADIIYLLKNQDKNYWVLKNFSPRLEDHVRERFGNAPANQTNNLYDLYLSILDEAVVLYQQNRSPESEQSLALAKKWWQLIQDFTGGDMTLLPDLMAFNESRDSGWDSEISQKQNLVNDYIGMILSVYFEKTGLSFPVPEEV